MSSLTENHIHPFFMLPSKLIAKFRGWIYGYVRLLLGMVCSVSCLFCVFTFIWYLAIRGLYGFLSNLQFIQTTGCDNGDDVNDLNIDYSEYQPGKRKSFLTRCRAQAELIQQALRKERTCDKTTNGNNIKVAENVVSQDKHNHCRNHNNPENSNHGLHVRNSSYISEAYYDVNGHKIGEQIYLTNDSNGLEESYFQFKVNDVQHLKDLGGLSTSILVEEEPLDEAQDGSGDKNGDGDGDVAVVKDEKERKISSESTTSNPSTQQDFCEDSDIENSDAKPVNDNTCLKNKINHQHLSKESNMDEAPTNNNLEKTNSTTIFEISVDKTVSNDTKDPPITTDDNLSADIATVHCVKKNDAHLNNGFKHENENLEKNKMNKNKHDLKEQPVISTNKPMSRRSRRRHKKS